MVDGIYASGLEHYTDPHAAIDHLRRIECGEAPSKWGPAPFSDLKIHTPATLKADTTLPRTPPAHVVSQEHPDLVDIPIRSIVGIDNFGNLGNPDEIVTFGDALFAALHGASLVFPESLDYLCSDSVKADLHPYFREMPQKENISSVSSKYLARGGIDFSCHDGRYIVCNGKQRTLIAMYAIWQREGPSGMLRNVRL